MSGVQVEANNTGGQNVGYIDAGDWMAFSNITIPAAGTYRVEYRVASVAGSTLSLDLNAGSVQLGSVAIPATGGWQNWTVVGHEVQLPAGTVAVGIYAPQGGWNLDWFKISSVGSSSSSASSSTSVPTGPLLFDDFSYTSTSQLSGNGWNIRTWNGGPGLSNGTWSAQNISFVTDPSSNANTLMRLKASTNVSANNISGTTATAGTSSQVEIARSEQIYKNGTWAARMYFTDSPTTGPDGDTAIQTFFGITSYIEGAEPYSEVDFEYLPNGGWWSGDATPAMWAGTYRLVDWSDPSNHAVTRTPGSLAGWRTLVMQVEEGQIAFYIDGVPNTSFSGDVAPDYPMYIMFQLWFSNDCFDPSCSTPGYLRSTTPREYYEDVDWVYYRQDTQLTPSQVTAEVSALRSNNISFRKTAY